MLEDLTVRIITVRDEYQGRIITTDDLGIWLSGSALFIPWTAVVAIERIKAYPLPKASARPVTGEDAQ